MKKVLFVVAHPDDETIGAGGTIAKHVSHGDSVFAISFTNGVGSRTNATPDKENSRMQSAAEAASILGFQWISHLSYPDNSLDTVPLLDIVRQLELLKADLNPDIVYTHSPADLNIDHRITCESVLVAFRPEPDEAHHELRLFEVPSATNFSHPGLTSNFNPLIFEGITNFWGKKVAALQAYGLEIRDFPHTRSIEGLQALATVRGNQVGLAKAEAFDLVRIVNR